MRKRQALKLERRLFTCGCPVGRIIGRRRMVRLNPPRWVRWTTLKRVRARLLQLGWSLDDCRYSPGRG